MKAEIIVRKDQSTYRIERGRAGAVVSVSDRPRLKINFDGGAVDVALTTEEAYRLGAALILSAEHTVKKKPHSEKRF